MIEPFAMPPYDEVTLTPRELQAVVFFACGLNTHQISALLKIGYKTVETHRQTAQKKIGARNLVDMCRWALAWGLIHLDGTPTPGIVTL